MKQAKKIKTCKVVSYDWLEDSLMNFTSKRTGPYLLKSAIKERAKAKAKRKQIRVEDIQKGRECPTSLDRSPPLADASTVKSFDIGCDEFKSAMLTGKLPSRFP